MACYERYRRLFLQTMDNPQIFNVSKILEFLKYNSIEAIYTSPDSINLLKNIQSFADISKEKVDELQVKSNSFSEKPLNTRHINDSEEGHTNKSSVKESNTEKEKSQSFMEFIEQRRKEKKLQEKEEISENSDNKITYQKVPSDWNDSTTLEVLDNKINSCLACKLGFTRNKFVFGEGNPEASILFVGEAPGADEDKLGRPFVGRAGKLLTGIIEAIGFQREEIFIANVIKCRPPANRKPETEEVSECKPYLLKQIELIKPDFIVALGLTAAQSLTGNKYRMKDTRGEFQDFMGTPLMITYHPAALLRNPNWKKDVWEDMKKLLAAYNQKHPNDRREAKTKKEAK